MPPAESAKITDSVSINDEFIEKLGKIKIENEEKAKLKKPARKK